MESNLRQREVVFHEWLGAGIHDRGGQSSGGGGSYLTIVGSEVAGSEARPSPEGGATTNSLPRSASMMQGTRLGSRDSCKNKIWSRRNLQSDTFFTDSDLASSATLSRETMLMTMWSRISSIERLSSAKGSRQTSMTEGARATGGVDSTTTVGSEVAG
jgi:hypothetical protein